MWMFSSFFGCLGPLVFLAICAFAARALWVTLMLPRGMAREPVCGRCGYPATGLAASACPECGVDWRIAGIATPAMIMRYRGGTGSAILAWTVLMGGLGFVALVLVGFGFMSRTTMARATAAAAAAPPIWTTPLTPASAAYKNVDTVTTITGGTTAGSVAAAMTLNDGSVWKFEIDPATRALTSTDPGGVTTTATYAPGSIAAWYTSMGLNAADPRIAAEAAELQTILEIQLLSPYTQPSQMSLVAFTAGAPVFSGGGGPIGTAAPAVDDAVIVMLVALGVWLILYVAGIIGIVVRRRRLLAALSGGPPR